MPRNIHTVYNSEREKWESKSEGSSTPLSSHQTKDNAVDRSRGIAKDEKVEHLIHGKNGQR